MKTGKKILLCILALILIAGIVCATMFVTNKNRIKEYSTYCMDEVRNQLGEYLENVSNFYEGKNEDNNWYLYSGKVSYEGANYDYYCRVSGKNDAEVFLINLTEGNESENYEDFVSYYDNGAIKEKGTYVNGKKEGTWTTYDEEGNIIDTQEFRNGIYVDNFPGRDLSVNEEKRLSTNELKQLCVEQLKEFYEKENPSVSRTDEKIFINTYGFKGIFTSNGTNNGSTVYCNIDAQGQIIVNGFFLDRGETMDEIHSDMDFGNAGGIGERYPNLKEFYGFVGTIIFGDELQSNYITGKNIMYYDKYRGIALQLGSEFDGGLIREVDTDEIGYPVQEIIFLVKGDENEENRTGINGYREVFTITAISKENLENFGVTPNFEEKIIGENKTYYFIGEKSDSNHYSNLTIFDVKEYPYYRQGYND